MRQIRKGEPSECGTISALMLSVALTLLVALTFDTWDRLESPPCTGASQTHVPLREKGSHRVPESF